MAGIFSAGRVFGATYKTMGAMVPILGLWGNEALRSKLEAINAQSTGGIGTVEFTGEQFALGLTPLLHHPEHAHNHKEQSDNDHIQLNAVVSAFVKAPPTGAEVNGVLAVLASQSELLKSVIPSGPIVVTDAMLEACLQNVRSILESPQLIQEAKKRILESAEKLISIENDTTTVHATAVHSHSSVLAVAMDPVDVWAKLRVEYMCTICQDVLAAPTLLNCSHSFCAVCVKEYHSACTSADVEVAVYCPQCKDDVVHSSFERLLDKDIQQKVDSCPDCEAKDAWRERRAAYEEIRKEAELKRKAAKVAKQLSVDAPESEEDDSWSDLLDEEFLVFGAMLIAMAVLSLIYATRARS